MVKMTARNFRSRIPAPTSIPSSPTPFRAASIGIRVARLQPSHDIIVTTTGAPSVDKATRKASSNRHCPREAKEKVVLASSLALKPVPASTSTISNHGAKDRVADANRRPQQRESKRRSRWKDRLAQTRRHNGAAAEAQVHRGEGCGERERGADDDEGARRDEGEGLHEQEGEGDSFRGAQLCVGGGDRACGADVDVAGVGVDDEADGDAAGDADEGDEEEAGVGGGGGDGEEGCLHAAAGEDDAEAWADGGADGEEEEPEGACVEHGGYAVAVARLAGEFD